MILWATDQKVSTDKATALVNQFTVGKDYCLDQVILPYDLRASVVHAEALLKMELINASELKTLSAGLKKIQELHAKGAFPITVEQEDGHTAIEEFLTDQYGAVGKKIHTARSRNDQVLTAVRLWQKDQLTALAQEVLSLIKDFENFEKQHPSLAMPGYTHTQRAMPTTIQDWSAAYREMLSQLEPLRRAALENIDLCPLGSAAGFGTSFPYPRDWVAKELGFKSALKIVNTAQNSRLKVDLDFLYVLLRTGQVLNQLAQELVLFTAREFGFFTVDEHLTTGSSIMPQKKNLDPAELIRGRYSVLWGYFSTQQQLGVNLMSGYHRDFQLSKPCLIESATLVQEMLAVASLLIQNLKPQPDCLQQACSPDLYATDQVNELVKQGSSFRDAYRQVKQRLNHENPEPS